MLLYNLLVTASVEYNEAGDTGSLVGERPPKDSDGLDKTTLGAIGAAGLGVVAIAVGTIFGVRKYRNKKNKDDGK